MFLFLVYFLSKKCSCGEHKILFFKTKNTPIKKVSSWKNTYKFMQKQTLEKYVYADVPTVV